MSLRTTQNVKNSHIWVKKFFIFLKSSYQAKEILALFWNSVSLTFIGNHFNDLKGKKVIKTFTFVGFWDKLQIKTSLKYLSWNVF